MLDICLKILINMRKLSNYTGLGLLKPGYMLEHPKALSTI